MPASIPEKVCPSCGRHWLLSAPHCLGCGHVFRTLFTAAGKQIGHRAPPDTAPKSAPPFGFAIVAAVVALVVIPWPALILLIFFGLLISIAAGVWKIAQRS